MRSRILRWTLALAAVAVLGRIFWQVGSTESVHDGAPAWSPDSQRIVFSVGRDEQSDLFVMAADGSDRRELTATPAEENAPTFSPDGRHIAFETNRDGNFEIYVMDDRGGTPRRLTSHPSEDRAPAWSPDGSHIAFLSDREHAKRFDLYTMRADGSDVVLVTSDRTTWSPQFAPDGHRMAVQAGGDIEILNLGGGPPTRLTFAPANGMSPTWSPDGARLAFTSTRNTRPELFLMFADGSNQQLLASMPGGSAIDPRWSPDGTRVAFVYVPDDKSKNSDVIPQYAIYTIDLATQKITRLSP